MSRFLFVLIVLLIPSNVSAARFSTQANTSSSFLMANALLSEDSSLGNVYAAGISVVQTAPVAGDFSATGGSVVTAAPIAGDNFLIAGSVRSRALVGGDFRAIGWSVMVEKPVGGDLVAFGFSARVADRPSGSVFVAAWNPSLENGATGPVILYGNSISLAGDFSDDVTVVASGRITLAASTTIRGSLSYESPEEAVIPASAKVMGDITYKNISYLPNAGTSQALSFVSIGFFLLVRVLGALILAGLLAGLFPRPAEMIAVRIYTERARSLLLTLLLGFAITVATPILLLVLALTFVGIGIALLLCVAYVLLLFLAFMYAGIVVGTVIARTYRYRETVLWHDGLLGMLGFSLCVFLPIVGPLLVFLLTLFSAGALLLIFFEFAFPHEEETPEMV